MTNPLSTKNSSIASPGRLPKTECQMGTSPGTGANLCRPCPKATMKAAIKRNPVSAGIGGELLSLNIELLVWGTASYPRHRENRKQHCLRDYRRVGARTS